MRILLAGPYVGEIGWELMSWQGYVRRVFYQERFDRLAVIGTAGKAAFYADMPLEYHEIDLGHLPGLAYEDRRYDAKNDTPIAAEAIVREVAPKADEMADTYRQEGHEVQPLRPSYAGDILPCDNRHQQIIQFQRLDFEPAPSPWVVFVERTRGFGAGNWSSEQWSSLKEQLAQHGIHASTYPCEAKAAITTLSQCDLAVGQSTCGLHLAALCGCPHLVWAPEETRLWTPWEITNRQRYETIWNPLATPVKFFGQADLPAPEQVAQWVRHAFPRIGRRTGSPIARARFNGAWRFRRGLAQHVVQKPFFRKLPWSMQKVVRSKFL